jgi:hypothetical protein
MYNSIVWSCNLTAGYNCNNLLYCINMWNLYRFSQTFRVRVCSSSISLNKVLNQFFFKCPCLSVKNGKNHRAGFELTTLVVIGTDCTCSWKSNYHMIKMAIFIIILKARNRQYSVTNWLDNGDYFYLCNILPQTAVLWTHLFVLPPTAVFGTHLWQHMFPSSKL